MKCPTCNKWSIVLETRPIKGGVKRRRECANLHRFTTHEMESLDEVLVKCHGRSVFDWMYDVLIGEDRNVLQPRKNNLREDQPKEGVGSEEILNSKDPDRVLDNIFKALERSRNEKR